MLGLAAWDLRRSSLLWYHTPQWSIWTDVLMRLAIQQPFAVLPSVGKQNNIEGTGPLVGLSQLQSSPQTCVVLCVLYPSSPSPLPDSASFPHPGLPAALKKLSSNFYEYWSSFWMVPRNPKLWHGATWKVQGMWLETFLGRIPAPALNGYVIWGMSFNPPTFHCSPGKKTY